VQEQEGEQRPEPLSVQGDGTAVLDDRQRPENAEFNGDLLFVAPVTAPEQAWRLEAD
jgi:hypothetical protein